MFRLFLCTVSVGLCAIATAHPPWRSSALIGSPDPPLPARANVIFEKLALDRPIGLLDLPNRNLRLLLETGGKLRVFAADNANPDTATVILDLAKLGEEVAAVRDMTLDPDFEKNGYVYLVWSIREQLVEGGTRVSRFIIPNTNPPTVDTASRLDVITYPSGDHVGASLRFGPDGYLYIGTGDGSGPNPPDLYRTAQNLGDVRGSILRIDVKNATSERPYQIPPDNPFVKRQGARPEIFSFGIRNAYRIEFDPMQGNLWVADVGWVRCEMLHRTFAGANHGWSLFEGPHTVDPTQIQGPGNIVAPAIAMPRAESQSITGGVFQAADSSFFPGKYLFGDYMNGAIWAADLSDPEKATYQKIADTQSQVISFSHLRLGKNSVTTPVVIDHRGRILKLELAISETSNGSRPPFPVKLSETGLFDSVETLAPAEGVIGYKPVAQMWRDGATGDRIVAVPTNEPIKVDRNRRRYSYPTGTVFANTITRDVLNQAGIAVTRRIETQILAFDGFNWNPYSYRWNEAQTDATLVAAFGEEATFQVSDPRHGSREFAYRFLARDQCKICHHIFHAGAITFTPLSLTGKSGSTDWQKLMEGGWVDSNLTVKQFHVPLEDESASLDQRARTYLDLNCATCHAPAGAGLSKLNVMFETGLKQTASIDELPLQGSFGLRDPRVIVAGHPEQSVLMYRMATSGAGRMPHIASEVPDERATKLIWDWIASMQPETKTDTNSEVKDTHTTSESLLTWYALLNADPEAAKSIVEERLASSQTSFDEGLFAPWIEPSSRKQLIGSRPDVNAILSLTGDAKRGASWFADVSGAQCRGCHRKNGIGVAMGPDLDGIGQKQTREQIVRSLLFPSETVEPLFRSKTFLLDDGSAISGLIVSETEKFVNVRATDGTVRQLEIDSIEAERENPQSMMPDGQLTSLTPQQVADLLEYLAQK